MNFGSWMRQNWWRVVVLTIGGWTGFYFALIFTIHYQYTRQISAQRTSGLAAVAGYDPVALWRQSSVFDLFHSPQMAAQRGRGAYRLYLRAAESELPDTGESSAGREIVRSAEFDLEVKSPAEGAERIRALAERFNGYLVSSDIGNDQSAPGGSIAVRVPASQFEEMRAELRKLAVRIETEKVDASDVTKEYVDKQARARNLQAEEGQYLTLLKRAVTVKDTLEVSDKLNAVRGQIEQQQAEFSALEKQVETVAIAVSLRAEADAQIFGVHWRPVYELKLAARDGLESIANYADAMTAALFRLPVLLLWLATIVAIAAVGWRSARWTWKRFFAI